MNVRYLSLALTLLTISSALFGAKNIDQTSSEISEMEFLGAQSPVEWKLIGTYAPNKKHREYSDTNQEININCFSKAADGILVLPKSKKNKNNQIINDRIIKIQLKNGKKSGKSIEITSDTLKEEVKTPTFLNPVQNGPTDNDFDCNVFISVEADLHSKEKNILIKKDKKILANFTCKETSQIALARDENGDERWLAFAYNNKAFLIDFEKNSYYTIDAQLQKTESSDVPPVVQIVKNLIFFQWEQTVYCFNTAEFIRYQSENTIKEVQISPDGNYMVIAEVVKDSKVIEDSKKSYLFYKLYELNKNVVVSPVSAVTEEKKPVVKTPEKKKKKTTIFSFKKSLKSLSIIKDLCNAKKTK